MTENPARALVATLLEVLKFTCKDERERERERENRFCQHHYQRNREFLIESEITRKRSACDCISMTNSKTALFLRETRCFDDEISHQTREPRAREVFMRAIATSHFRSRRRISKAASKYSSHHPRKNHLFCRLGLKTRRLDCTKARDSCSKSPSRIPTRTKRNENSNAFAYLGGDLRGSNGRSSQRKHFVFVQVCVCVLI